jgi:hypothetical protein
MNLDWRPVDELTVYDLNAIPVWEWQECDGGERVRATTLESVPEADGSAVYIAFTRFTLADGTVMFGFCSPGDDSGLDYIQPVIVSEHGHWNLWEGMKNVPKSGEAIFPLVFECLVECEGRRMKSTIQKANRHGKQPTSGGCV